MTPSATAAAKRDLSVDLCVIGAGAAGLSVAAGCAQLGLSVVLFEAGEMGGDCLNTGCVPSKALIAAAKAAHAMRHADKLGLAAVTPHVDWTKVRAHVEGVIATIAPIDSQERFEGLGCTVVREWARFTGPETVESETVRVRAPRFVVASGARAFVPPIPGLSDTAFVTNETVFAQDTLPARLIVLGGGVIGVELGQAFARLGSQVTIVEAASVMGPQEPEAVEAVRTSLLEDGVTVLEGVKAVAAANTTSGGVVLTLEDGRLIEGDRLLVAVGRAARVENMGLEAAGVRTDRKGIVVDDQLRSVSNRRVWAVGDIAGRELLTHAAGYHASVFVRNALFKAPASARVAHLPAVAYCDPEVARIGLSEAQARAEHGDAVSVTTAHAHDNDRAQAERDTAGFCKLVLGKGGRILGATVVGHGAGESIQVVGLAMSKNLTVTALTGVIAPYPTRTEIVKRAAGAHFTPRLFSKGTRRLISVLKRFG
jgi:pyruvate/2-oxoglutarate dehydrogenase complex dihydrolipoamide dehydrogenase (E3) component